VDKFASGVAEVKEIIEKLPLPFGEERAGVRGITGLTKKYFCHKRPSSLTLLPDREKGITKVLLYTNTKC
jgi:hypothetical protein